jgi:site-specific DNA-cytosine methylase
MKGINVLSLFGGIECGRVALEKRGVKVANYFSSEIDPYAIQITSKNYPEIFHI